MEQASERRRHVRYFIPVPVAIMAPRLSDVRLVPEDISAGGFRVVVYQEPDPSFDADCAIQISGQEFQGVRARPAWIEANPTSPPTWTIGVSTVVPADVQPRLENHLRTCLGGRL